MKKKVLSGLLALALVFGSAAALPEGVFEISSNITASAVSTATSGKCGENVKWKLTDGKLTISGTGEMTDYSNKNSPFCDRTDIQTVVIGSGVTSIGNRAFCNCSKLVNITIPDSVTRIGNSALKDCESLTDVTIPSGVISIDDYAFSGCKSLKSVTIPNSVKYLGTAAFINCESLTSVTIPSSVTYIYKSAFSNCKSLTSVTIPNSVSSIDEYAFAFCESLKSVTIPNSVKIINEGAFYECTNLESITIPDSVTSIGTNALYNCPRIKSVIVPKSVTSIGEKALGYYDDNGTEKKVNWFMICCERYSAADTYAWDNGFDRGFIEGDYIYQYGYSDSMIVDYIGSEANITVPSQLGGKTVTSIRGGSFGSCKSIVSLTIPDTVIVIGDSAFSSCTNLKSITLPNQLDCISRWLFEGCTSLEKITIPSSAEGISRGAFYGCTSLTSVTIPSGVKYLVQEAFKDCTSLKSVTIPGSVTNIDYNVFKNCTSLTSVTIKNGVTAIGYYMFEGCSKLSSVSIPDSVTTIEPYAFFDCTSLKKVTVPKTVETIGTKALGYYHDERGAVIPDVDFIVRCYKDSPADEYAKNNYVKIEYIDVKHVAAKDPTCTAAGNIEYWTWNKKYFSDALCTKEITKAQTVRKATGHSYGKPTWTWTGTKAATAKFVCANDKSHVETVTAKITSKTTKATCTADGKTVYTATVTFGGKTYTDTKTVTITKTGHKWGTPTWTWDGVKSATAKFTCANDKSHTKTVTAKISSTTTKATCEKDGKTVYTATVTFNGQTYTNTKTVTITKTGHKFSDWKTTKAATTKTEGEQTRTCSVCKKTEKRAISKLVIDTQRVAGDNRYATAAEIAKAAYPSGAKTVVLANGLVYADALVGVPLAKSLNAPILLATDKSLPRETTNALEKLGTKNVIILGGYGAISEQVEKTLNNQGITTERYEGKSRFGTAAAIAEKLSKKPTSVFFVYYNDFPDALSASTVAAIKNAPIIYLTTKGDIHPDTAAYLAKLKKAGSVKNAYIIGGTGVIDDDMKNKVGTALGVTPKRLAGANRYETCVEVNKYFKNSLSGTSLCLATGADYPDALAGGVFAAIQKAPLFLVNGKVKNLNLSDKQKAYLKTRTTKKIFTLGGKSVVPDSHVKTIVDEY